MPALSQVARISLSGFRSNGVDGFSPIEDQARVTYEAARHYATTHGFTETFGTSGPGYQGPLVMAQITGILFSNNPDRNTDQHNAILYRALRASGAARCINHGKDRTPTWFIAAKMPFALPEIAKALQSGSAGIRPSNISKLPLTDTERKLTKKEAGEDRQPPEVKVRTVTVTETETTEVVAWPSPAVEEAFREKWLQQAENHRKLVNRVYDEVATNPQPLTAGDVQQLLAADGIDMNLTTIHNAIRELMEMGRLVSRKETRAEALVRGGGQMPKAKRPMLFAAAPGPVPERTALPTGVKPTRSLDQRLLDELERRYPKTAKSRPRSVGQLATVTDTTVPEVRAALERLIKRGTVYESNSNYYLTSRRRSKYGAEQAPAETETGVITVTDGVITSDGHEPSKEATEDSLFESAASTRDIVNQIGALVGQLASQAGTRDEHETLIRRIRQLEAQNRELVSDLESLRGRVREILG